MIHIKNEKEIAIMAKGGKILSDVLFKVLAYAQPGVSEIELDKLAEELIRKKGGEPGFKKVSGYNHTICISTNNVVVHGIPTIYRLKPGDVVGIDCGVYLNGFHTDMSETKIIQNSKFPSARAQGEDKIQNEGKQTFLDVGKRALEEAIRQAKIGNRIGHISKTIQDIVEKKHGYGVVRSLVGHGVGRQLHEEPEVPGFLTGAIEKTPRLVEGMVIAIEIIYNMGKPDVVYSKKDDWTILSADGSVSGLFERTVAITSKGPVVLTS
ncbi:MAG: type I methionyl aminopeptidase [Candidatus Levybacteria bacterium]|nr:type I methionyl aminopeptidase [Candidatus Levybacteria bacterium]